MTSHETPPHSIDIVESRAAAPALADLLRERTRVLHTRAERSGVIADLLHGRATRRAHALLLRNLLPAYESLEQGLERHRSETRMAALAQPCVYRSAAIESDLRAVVGDAWAVELPLLPEAERYAARVRAAAAGRVFRAHQAQRHRQQLVQVHRGRIGHDEFTGSRTDEGGDGIAHAPR